MRVPSVRARAIHALFSLLLPVCFGLSAPAAHAESLKDRAKRDVAEGIDRSKAKKKKKDAKAEPAAEPAPEEPPATPSPEPSSSPEPSPEAAGAAESTPPSTEQPAPSPEPPEPAPADAASVQFSFNSDDDLEPEEKEERPKGPQLPVRVLGDDVKLDITLGAGYRGWYPQQYDAVDVEIASYFTWNVDIKAKLFKFLTLRRGYYESNGVSGPRTKEAAVAAQIGAYAPKAAWLLGVIGVPISKAWEPQIRYESRAFDTKAVHRDGVDLCVVPRSADDTFDTATCTRSTEPLKIISTYETFVAGVRYDHAKRGTVVVEQKGSKIPPLFFGVGLMQYRKPYQINVDGYVPDRMGSEPQLLFNGRFRGAGLALGADFVGGLDRFFGDADMQIGLGEVSLTDKLTLNQVVSQALPTDPLIGYLQGTGGIGYRWTMIHAAPTLILVPQVRVGGATFFLVNTKTDQDQESTSPSFNWDLFWTAQLSLLIPL